jgi:hypothetical protein
MSNHNLPKPSFNLYEWLNSKMVALAKTVILMVVALGIPAALLGILYLIVLVVSAAWHAGS